MRDLVTTPIGYVNVNISDIFKLEEFEFQNFNSMFLKRKS